ncbi:MAG: tail fiber protein [Candidatus Azobacteroides sp.]|nr:tail fiber protein [Candidatus Azobacteroides sp.]
MKHIFLFFACFLLAATSFAQGNSGLGFNYQAVVRGLDGFVMPLKSIELRFSLMPGQQATQASWIEIQKVITDAYGTIGVTIGKGTKAGGVAATFADVNFAAVHYWLKVEINENGNYRELSYTALASVPYAEAATNAVSSPVGSVMPFAGDASKVPAGWLLCDGSAISRSDYAALYAVIGTAWGFGNNSTTFNLPDMRGVFLRGVDDKPTGSQVDGNRSTRTPLQSGGNSGVAVGSFQNDAAPNITGSLTNNDSDPTGAGALTTISGTRGYPGSHIGTAKNIYLDASLSSIVYGRDNTTEIRPKNVYVYYIIKY